VAKIPNNNQPARKRVIFHLFMISPNPSRYKCHLMNGVIVPGTV
jgi:hypothetical protein